MTVTSTTRVASFLLFTTWFGQTFLEKLQFSFLQPDHALYFPMDWNWFSRHKFRFINGCCYLFGQFEALSSSRHFHQTSHWQYLMSKKIWLYQKTLCGRTAFGITWWLRRLAAAHFRRWSVSISSALEKSDIQHLAAMWPRKCPTFLPECIHFLCYKLPILTGLVRNFTALAGNLPLFGLGIKLDADDVHILQNDQLLVLETALFRHDHIHHQDLFRLF